MSDILEKLNNQIEIDKEILSVLPKNNKKNVKAYQDKAEGIKEEYVSFLNDITAEIKRRAVKINSISPNSKIDELAKELEGLEKIKLLDSNKTSFEKMELDEMLYVLKRFYKNNLELVNENILNCIEKFKTAGINLEDRDFNYSVYTKEYMDVFLEETKRGEPNSTRVKETFEQIYWKCPDIILHIELNFRSLYLKYEKQITNYFENEEKKLVKDMDLNKKKAIEKYNSMKIKLQELKNKDTALILEKFKSGNDNIKDYEQSTVQKNYKKLTGLSPEDIEKDTLEEYNQNIEKLSDSLNEYRCYLKYKFIYDGVIAIYNDKQKYKKFYNDKLKQIQKLEGKLFKGNKKIEKYSRHRGLLAKIFGKNQKKLEKINIDTNAQIIELKTAYRELEENKVKNIIIEKLSDSSTICDALMLAASFYSFLVDTIINQFSDISQDDISSLIQEFREFVQFPNMTIINNIKIIDNKDIVLVIKDKYNLCNINLEKTDFAEENITSVISTAKNISNYNYILNSRVSVDDIKFIIEANKILGIKN